VECVKEALEGRYHSISALAHAQQSTEEDAHHQVDVREPNLDSERDKDSNLLVGGTEWTTDALDGTAFWGFICSLPEDEVTNASESYKRVQHASDVHNVHETEAHGEEVGEQCYDTCVLCHHPHHHIEIFLSLECKTYSKVCNQEGYESLDKSCGVLA